MHYKVVVTNQAYSDLDNIVYYILFELKNEQAARAVLDDFDVTICSLKNCAGSLKLCENERLRDLGYHRINFLKHEYFMLYRIAEGGTVTVDKIFHQMQDYESKIW